MPSLFDDPVTRWVILVLISVLIAFVVKHHQGFKPRPYQVYRTQELRDLIRSHEIARRVVVADRDKRELDLEDAMIRRYADEEKSKNTQDRTLEQIIYKGIDAKNSELKQIDEHVREIRAELSFRARLVRNHAATQNNG